MSLVTIGGYLLVYIVLQAGTVNDRLHPALPAMATALAVVVVGLFERSRARSAATSGRHR